jgi:predicted nucleotide-binding protein
MSWSGIESYRLASALRDWIPEVLQEVQPWLAPKSAESGARWLTEAEEVLRSTQLVLLCVTKENHRSSWLHFEAGVASRILTSGNIAPYLLDLTPADLVGPLATFQAVTATRDSTLTLIHHINTLLDGPLSTSTVDRIFELSWPRLEATLDSIRGGGAAGAFRAPDDVLTHVSEDVRRLTIVVAQLSEKLETHATPLPVTQPRRTPPPRMRPRLFIGSSSEGLPIAEALQANMDGAAEITVWNQDLFQPSKTVIETLVDSQSAFDFAVIVLTADDLISKRGVTSPAPRDNLIFELGLFTGSLGRARTFLMRNRDRPIELPSDLDGVTSIEYGERSDGNLIAATGSCSLRIRRAMGLA